MEYNGIRPFYRSKHFDKVQRREEKLSKNCQWYKNRKKPSSAESTFTSVFFVPATPGSKLFKMLKQTEQKYQIGTESRIKFIETSGRKFIDHLRIKDPFSENCAPEIKCFPCRNATKQTNCKMSNIGYTVICQTCKDKGITRTYEGETARNAHIRGNEHLKDLERKNDKSVLYRHVKKEHSNEENEVEFKMKTVGRFKTTMSRQINEGIRIQSSETLINSKRELYGTVVHRKVLDSKQKNQS